MDLIFHNGRVWTGCPAAPWASAVAVSGSRIAAVGGGELLEQAEECTRVIDLGGLPLLPGLGDSHLHLAETGRGMELADLSPAASPAEMGAILRAFIRERQIPPGRLVLGWGWNQDRFPSRRMPTLRELDAMAPENPLVLTRVCQHIAAANSAAMALGGIGAATPDPEGGEIGRDETGRPDGIFRENAMELLPQTDTGPVTQGDLRRWLKNAMEKAASLGLTAVHTDDLCTVPGLSWREVLEVYRRLAQEDALPVRVVEQCLFPSAAELEEFFALGYHPGWAVGNFSVGPLKIVSDGSLGARTALLTRPYADDPAAGTGMPTIPQEEMEAQVLAAHRHGMGAVIHAIGDGAIDRALDAIRRAREAFPEIRETPCHGIVHCQITRPDQLRRIRELGVQVLAQPVFLEYDLHMADLRVGEELGKTSYAWRTLAEAGVPLSAGSDSPIESMDPFGNLYCAVTRRDYRGEPAGGWHPWERLTLEQALTAATAGVAFAAGYREGGRIAPGLPADFTAPDRDIFALPPESLLHTAAAMTVVGGRIVHSQRRV